MAQEPSPKRSKVVSFCDQLQARVDETDSLLCIGLDPHINELPEPTAKAAVAFCKRIIDATLPYAAAYKPNAAFFERFGAEGHIALVEVMGMLPSEVPVVLDAKRGDIGSTSEAYAAATIGKDGLNAHAVTVNPYMGSDSLSPFLKDPAKGVFVLCKTSNPGSKDLQTLKATMAAEGGQQRMVYEEVARLAASEWGVGGNVGLVVGATDLDAMRNARAVAPKTWFLSPGLGAQGGDLEGACAAGFFLTEAQPDQAAKATGVLFPVSRGVSKAVDPGEAAKGLRDSINAARAAFVASKASTAAAAAAAAESEELAEYQSAFIDFAVKRSVLRFGSFTLKSGRQSPYFFNAGLFNTGGGIGQLASFYASAISAAPEFKGAEVLFGPAYKGIPLATSVGMALAQAPFDRDLGVCYNRKEAKDHGEGGLLVGAALKDKQVLILDDVITAGTAIREAVAMVKANGGTVCGVVIALDRQERGPGPDAPTVAERESAVMSVEKEFGCPVRSIVGLSHLTAYLKAADPKASAAVGAEAAAAVAAYRAEYGVC